MAYSDILLPSAIKPNPASAGACEGKSAIAFSNETRESRSRPFSSCAFAFVVYSIAASIVAFFGAVTASFACFKGVDAVIFYVEGAGTGGTIAFCEASASFACFKGVGAVIFDVV